MKFQKFSLGAIGLSFLLFSQIATAEKQMPEKLSEDTYNNIISSFDKSKDCIKLNKRVHWKALNTSSLLVYTRANDMVYYLSLKHPRFDIDFAQQIGLNTSNNFRFCGNIDESVYFGDQQYRVKAIKKINKEMATQLIAYRDNE
ncbi:DUF6491 family protein [Paremcibacter congregatus]|uniref:Uncharacterized protein n=1 Tax=Paremcibacter congregatus TaxID=2043170 RepID=A0A2G4YXU7_9PROT|nr:DUF6491 family protein [Paremcibacter congregatus]PHZ86256.1 hypothetical protein CRD36_06215 [Paremcibacter congregatus]QDE27223.1 hypothetical protein FIV45_07980 [Paremcibacter congregatus]